MKLSRKTAVAALLSFTLVHGSTAMAGMYKWVDDNGETQYGDRIPPEYADKERRKLNKRGRTLEVYDAARTPEEIAAAERREALKLEKQRQEAEQDRKDHVLLATYSDEDDMLKTRNGRLASIEGLIQLTSRRIESMNQRMKRLTEDAADFERGGKPVPDVITRQMENIRTQTDENEAFIQLKQEEQDEIIMEFESHIRRFRELKEED